MAVGDLLIPSVLEAFCDWQDPTVADDALELLELAPLSYGPDEKAAWLSELFGRVVEALEPTLILLALTDHQAVRILVASSGGPHATSLALDRDMRIGAIGPEELPAAVTAAFTTSPTVVALQTAPRFDVPVPHPGIQDGWLVVPLTGSSAVLDLGWVVNHLLPALDPVHSAILADVRAAVGDTPLGDLREDPTIPSGLLTLYDPATWTFRSVESPDGDALDEADPDALAIFALANRMLARVSAGDLDAFLHEEVGRDIWGVVDLRGRLDDTRDDRRILRRGLRGARRRRRKIGEDGHRRDFRRAQSRTLTWTEVLFGLHEMGVADILHPPAAPADPGTDEPGSDDPGTDEPGEPEVATGTLRFRVLDDAGAPVEGARIELHDLDNALLTTGLTAGDGTASVEGPPGEYTAVVTLAYHHDTSLAVSITADVTTDVDVELDRDLVRCSASCLKIYTHKTLSADYTPLHSCRVYLFEDESGIAWTGASPEVREGGEIDFWFLRNKRYGMYFAGRTLSDAEIERLRTERSYLLTWTTVSDPILRFDHSFFWWIALLQYVEDHLVPETSEPASEVLTCVRELYYDELNWTFLIDRDHVSRLIDYSSLTGAHTVRDGMDLAPIMALGRTYELSDTPGYFVMTTEIGWKGPTRVRHMLDRHEFVILPGGEQVHIGHALAGLEAFLFPPSPIGSLAFGFPKSAATWAGDLGQAVYTAFAELIGWWRSTYDALLEDDPDAIAREWGKARDTVCRPIEMRGDVHGIALGQRFVLGSLPGVDAHLPAGVPLSEMLEDYFLSPGRGPRAVGLFVQEYEDYGLVRDDVANRRVSSNVGLRDEVSSFAETWDDTLNPLAANWQGSGPTDGVLITLSLEHLNDILEEMDP